MRILIVNYEYPPIGGGGGIATQQTAEEMAKRHQVDVLTTRFANLPRYEKRGGVNIYRVRVLGRKEMETATLTSLLTYVPSAAISGLGMKRKKYDIVNSQFVVPSGLAGNLLAKYYGVPHVISIHGGDIYEPSKKTSPHRYKSVCYTCRSLLNRADRVIAQSSNTLGNARKYLRYTKGADIIPLGLVTPKYRPATRAELGLDSDNFYLVSIGRMIPRKGYDILIRALAEIKDPRVHLLIIGEGPKRTSLQKLAQELGIESRVHMLGAVSEETKFQYLNASDLYVLSSWHEGFGVVLLEAMYVGLPIVATNVGGQVDILSEGENSLLVRPGDPSRLAGAIRKVHEDRNLLSKFNQNNLERIKNYSIEATAKKYESLFQSLTS